MDLDRIAKEIAPLLEVHGVELVAIEWHQGPGHGILRIFIDRPGGDPRVQDPDKSIGLEEITNVTRDVSTAMDALDLIENSYTLEIGSPGLQRPVQKREDFDRFAGLGIRMETRGEGREKHQLNGTLRGTVTLASDGHYAVRLEVAGKIHEIARDKINRAKLHEIVPPKREKPGKGPSRRQERLAAREKARAINAAHQAAHSAVHTTSTPDRANGAAMPDANEPANHEDKSEKTEPNTAAQETRAAKR
jgi:ribosome maturation factor RimP